MSGTGGITFGSEVVKKLGVKVGPGTVVVSEGDMGREMYIVHKGTLEVVKNINGQDQVLGKIEAGGFFGELSLLNNDARTATVRAVEPSVLLKVTPKGFDALLRKMPDLSLKVIMALASRLRASTEQVASLQETEDDIKYLKAVISKIKTMGSEMAKGLKVPISLDQIARDLNTPEPVFNMVRTDILNAQNVFTVEAGAFIVPSLKIVNEFLDFFVKRKRRQSGANAEEAPSSEQEKAPEKEEAKEA